MILQLILNTLIIGSGYGLIAMAFRLMYSVSPFFNMTLGAVGAFGAYAFYWCTTTLGLPFYAVLPIVILASALFAYVLEAFCYTPMRNHGASGMILLVASLGVYTIFESIIHLIFGPQYQTLGDVNLSKMINLGFEEIPMVQFVTIIANFAVFYGLNIFLHKTFMGKQIRAVNDSAHLSNIIGQDNNKIILIVSILTGGILGLAGVLVGFDTGMQPTMGFNLLFKGMIGAIIGGMANLRGAFLGAFFLAFAENLGVWLFASEWRDLVSFVIFIAFLSIRPHGIFQKKERS